MITDAPAPVQPVKTVIQVAPKKRRVRDLSRAVTLRPMEVYQYYGVAPSTLRDWCLELPEADRLPSRMVPGRQGRRGVRLIEKAVLDKWLERWGAELPKVANDQEGAQP